MGNLFDSIVGPVTRFTSESGFLVDLFETYLPVAVEASRVAVEFLKQAFSGIGAALGEVFNSVKSLGPLIAVAIGGSFAAAAGAIQAFIAVLAGVAAAVQIVIASVRGMAAILTGNFDAAKNAMLDGVGAARSFSNAILDLAKAPFSGLKSATDLAKNLSEIDISKFRNETAQTAKALADLNESALGSNSGTGGGGGGGGASTSAVAKMMNTLYDLTRRWFGLRSDLEEGLLGPNGFEATVAQIAAMGQKLVSRSGKSERQGQSSRSPSTRCASSTSPRSASPSPTS